MLAHWDAWNAKRSAKLTERIRKGIPDGFRGKVWPLLLGATKKRAADPDLYARTLRGAQEALANARVPSLSREAEDDPSGDATALDERAPIKVHDSILRDVDRTFPQHVLFRSRSGHMQTSLLKVLHAYSHLDPHVGYCQGMGVITGVLLCYLTEEDAFFALVSLMQDRPWLMHKLFGPKMTGASLLMDRFDEMFAKALPDLAGHFAEQGVVTAMFCSHWLITVFAYAFPFDVVLRVWDAFFREGYNVLFAASVATLSLCKDELLKKPFEEVLTYIRHVPESVETHQLMAETFRLLHRHGKVFDFASDELAGLAET